MGYRANDLFAGWHDLGCHDHLSGEDVAALERLTDGSPQPVERVMVEADETFRRHLDLRRNDLLFVELDPLDG